VQIHAGEVDPLVPPPQSEALAKLLADAGAEVKLRWISGGHALTREDMDAGKEWFGFSSLSQGGGRGQW
jgi:phospholipase/carboxylesterase